MRPFDVFTRRANKRQSSLEPRRLTMESLEKRRLMAGVASFTFAPSTGILTIHGTGADDTVNASTASYGVTLSCSAPAGTNGVVTKVAPVQGIVKKIRFFGNAGNDTFRNNTGIPCEAHGGIGKDLLQGGANNDMLYGDAGDDELHGGAGVDKLYGGANTDWLFGEAGADYLYGEGGNDSLVGGRDGLVDTYYGGAGKDAFFFPAVITSTQFYFSEFESMKDGNSQDGVAPWFA